MPSTVSDFPSGRKTSPQTARGIMPRRSATKPRDPAAVESGQLIARRRKELHLTQIELAAQIHAAQSTVAEWERGDSRPRPHRWSRLAAVLRCDITDIMPDVRNKPGYNIWNQLSDQDRADIVDRNSLEHAYLYAFDQLTTLRHEFPEFFEAYRFGFGIGFITGEREIALFSFKIVHGFASTVDAETVVARVIKQIAEIREGIAMFTGVIRKISSESAKTD